MRPPIAVWQLQRDVGSRPMLRRRHRVGPMQRGHPEPPTASSIRGEPTLGTRDEHDLDPTQRTRRERDEHDLDPT